MKKIKKGIFGCIAGATLALAGCAGAGAHVPERTQNATTAAEYQAALEICVQKAMKLIDAGAPKEEVQSGYEKCADDADKKFGRK